ncbi:MAG: tRNA (adenosine(37)-N6)-threonylcarbamoyltransferase complex dimerization subunit type 1 TsaB [Cytophagales bacterium]|nr:tRNA (adenosine(37)-N6)-threonylcarbamoyltransferase complex dimerization subunit type 1 TsaB [Cytophagales bacterium]
MKESPRFSLALETATEICSVALFKDQILLAHTDCFLPRQHMILVPKLIERLLDTTRVRIQDISQIWVSQGPGSYTGLRCASSLAKGIALGLGGIPILYVPTLLGMVQQLRDITAFSFNYSVFCPVLASRRGEIFCTAYADESLLPLQPPDTKALSRNLFEEFIQETGKRLIVLGPHVEELKNHLPSDSSLFKIHPSAKSFAHLGVPASETEKLWTWK